MINLTETQLEILGISDLPVPEQNELLADIEQAVTEMAVAALLPTLSETEQTTLNETIVAIDSLPELYEHLSSQYSQFASLYEQAVTDYISLLADAADETVD